MKNNYDVGYCKPPKETQFKRGYSGNMKGWPKKDKDDFFNIISSELQEKISLNNDHKITKEQAICKQFVNSAVNGQKDAIKQVVDLQTKWYKKKKSEKFVDKLMKENYISSEVIDKFISGDNIVIGGEKTSNAIWNINMNALYKQGEANVSFFSNLFLSEVFTYVSSCILLQKIINITRREFHFYEGVDVILEQVAFDKDDKQECLERALDDIFTRYGESSVFLLGRNNYDIEFIDKAENSNLTVTKTSSGVKVHYKKHPQLKISFLTVHKSKGLEADNVIIINCKNDYLGFPNKVADDPILQLLLSDEEPYRYAEERRLMYVALTRTKNMTYLLVPKKDPSEFVMELNSMGVVDINNEDIWGSKGKKPQEKVLSCPRCKTGKLVKRESKGKTFYGCSNYPKCDYTCENPSQYICSRCGGIMVLRTNKKDGTKFYGCSNYPTCRNTFNADPKKRTYNRYSKRSYRRKWY